MTSSAVRTRGVQRRWIILVSVGLGVVSILSVAVAESSSAAGGGAGRIRAAVSWELDDRFGLDGDGDGLVEVENTAEHAHHRHVGSCPGECPPVRLWTTLTATPTADELGVPQSGILTYQWHVDGPAGSATYHRTKPALRLLLPEGGYEVLLRVRMRLPWGSATLSAREDLSVDDVVVAVLGDSYASGEGSPDARRDGGEEASWADASTAVEQRDHSRAHRSTVAWPVRVALALEDADRHTSVTFIDLAASSASIDRGILAARGEPALDAQIDRLASIVQQRQIDVLLLQVGGNDVGFSRVIRGLIEADPLLNPICYEVMVANVWAAAADGIWDRGVTVHYDPPFDFSCRATPGGAPIVPGLDGLGGAFGRLATALDDLDVAAVYLVEYPDPTGRAIGETCDEIVGDATAPFPFHEVDEEEQTAGIARVLNPLNRELERAAEQHEWRYVSGVAAAFADGRGYCAPWPDYGYPPEFRELPLLSSRRIDYPEGWYRPPSRYGGALPLNGAVASWYRTAAQSAALQGPAPRFLTSGTLHPNELGHMAIARIVLEAID